MKYSKITLKLLVVATILFNHEQSFAQSFKYPFGFMPQGLTTEKLTTEYTRWKKNIVSECNGGYRVNCKGEDGEGATKVEGMGFGMFLTAYMGDQKEFDGLYKFYKSKCTSNSGNMMDWQVTCGGGGQGSATDGDVEVAFSLIIASWQWPDGNYKEEAKKVIDNLRKQVVKSCTGEVLSLATGYSGGAWGGCDYTDISYYNPAAFREFAKVCNPQDSATWIKMADDTYVHLNRSANSNTGLVPDWQYFDGRAGGGGRNGTYAYDACRAPWRIAMDYLWNGNQKAREWCVKISDWAYKVGPSKIVDGYSLSGGASGGNHNMCFTGGFACAAMCNTQKMADDFAKEMSNIASRDNTWFTFSVGLCNMVLIAGKQWRPDFVIDNVQKADNRIRKSLIPVSYEISNNHNLVIKGLQPGQVVSLISLSGRELYHSIVNGASLIVNNKLQSGCYLLNISNGKKASGRSMLITSY